MRARSHPFSWKSPAAGATASASVLLPELLLVLERKPPATGAAPSTTKVMIEEPVDTLSPAAILISFAVPANGAGTSGEALSAFNSSQRFSSSTVS